MTIRVFDGGVELINSGPIGSAPPGGFGVGVVGGALYILLGSKPRVEVRCIASNGYATTYEDERPWNITDLAHMAGATEVDPDEMLPYNEAFPVGNILVENQTYKERFSDICAYEIASIGFTQRDEFYARRILPVSDGDALHVFTDGENCRAVSVSPLPGMERRVHMVDVKAGASTKSSLAKIVPTDVRDMLVREPWARRFRATGWYHNGMFAKPTTAKDADSSAEIAYVEIQSNEFVGEESMQPWVDMYFSLFGGKTFNAFIEAQITPEVLKLNLLDKVTLSTDRFQSGHRQCRIWSIDQQLKRGVIRFGLWSQSAGPTYATLEQVDDVLGSGGDGAGTGATGRGDAAPQDESYVIACSDETTALVVKAPQRTFFVPYDFRLTEVQASLAQPQTSGSTFTVDINNAGVSILSTKLTIDNTESSSVTAAVAPQISSSLLLKGDKVTIDIDQVGNGTAKGLIVSLIGYQV